MSERNTSSTPHESPPWGRTAKAGVALITLVIFVALAHRFRTLIAQLVVAAMVAYILNPIVVFLDRRTRIRRRYVVIIAYLALAILIAWMLVSLGVAAYQQVSNFIEQIPALISRILTTFETLTSRTEPIVIGTYAIDPRDIPWEGISNQILGLAEPVLGQGGQFVRQAAGTTIRWIGNLLFVFVISIYIANEIPRLGEYIAAMAQPPGYRQDAERLMAEFGQVWSAYLRGQVILGLVVGGVVWIGLAILGVQNALALGLLSGLLEFIPILGPVIGAGAAMLVAFFQPANYLGLTSLEYAGAVLLLMFAIQQLENNILVPYIVGEALDMHPLLVMVAVFMGGSMAGIIGAILAAPVAASLKLIGLYAWRKMFDLPPFPEETPGTSPSISVIQRGYELARRLRRRLSTR